MPTNEVYLYSNATNAPLKSHFFYMTEGEKLRLKLSGFINGHRLTLRPWIDTGVVTILQSGPANWSEQRVVITALRMGRTTVVAFEPGDNPNQAMSHCTVMNGRYTDCFPHLTIEVLSKVNKPTDLSAEQLALYHVLLVEVRKPMDNGYNEEHSVQSMQLMRQALLNRLKFPRSRELQVPPNNPTLLGLITARNVIKDFESYPALPGGITKNINTLFNDIANNGQHPHFLATRRLLRHAASVAKGEMPNLSTSEPVYAWRTESKGSPGAGYKELFSLAGQTFFGLRQTFIDGAQGKKK